MIERHSLDQGNLMLRRALKLTTAQNPLSLQNSDSYVSEGTKRRPTRTSYQTDSGLENVSEDHNIVHVTSEHRVLKRKGDSELHRRKRRRVTTASFAKGQTPIAISKRNIKSGPLREEISNCDYEKVKCVLVDLTPIKNKKH
ncbi:unnamed protein product [Arctia plantaginis]|uniref:Uncharacterized protein n=1 Tax=Arctia plantaginis TaxID=874455 RepID=A0A8S1BMV6_ARCPL|nr:unnamed protein product [Arctia plantaginis]CAB3260458.1 unnamed protein product [Arctia plantaginis]